MKPFLKFGLCAALAALMLGSVYAYMGNPRIIGPDAVISASTVTTRMVDEITLTGQWKYEFTTPPDTEITNEFNPISASAVVKWSVTPALDGSGFSSSSGGPYSTNISHVNPVYFSVLSGGVYTVTLTATSDLFQTEQVNILHVTELHADIVTNAVVVAAGTTNIPFPLTPESYGSMSWTLTPELENGAEFASTSDEGAFVDAGTVGTSYVVQVVTPALTTCWDTATLVVITNYTIVASSLYIALSNTVTATSWTVDGNGTAVKTNSDWTIPQGDDKVRYLSGTNLLTSTTGVDTVTIIGIAGSAATNDVRVHGVASGAPTLADDEWFTIIKIDFKRDGACSGFDDTLTPPWIMVPKTGDNTAIAQIDPSAVANQVGFVSADTSKATVSPATASASPQTITVSGVAKGDTEIQAKPSGSSVACATLKVTVRNRIDKTVVIHAITEENDDVQVIPVGQGQPNQTCITAGTNGVLNTTAAGDDTVSGDTITTGPNGICNTTASGDDVQVIIVGHGKANATCVSKGANSFHDSTPSGDDAVSGDDIHSGADGVCNTTASSVNVVPVNVPTAAGLQSYLNDTIWGRQANVYFTVTRSDETVNFDLDRDGKLDDPYEGPPGTPKSPPQWDEVNAVRTVRDTSVDYNIYYVSSYEYPIGLTVSPEVFTQGTAPGCNSVENHTAHEVGHLLGRSGESSDVLDVMYQAGLPSNPCRVLKYDWDAVNP